ncbi:MAG: cysteine peptidase family C39 domain-containing protein [Minisyncoccia bacterium]
MTEITFPYRRQETDFYCAPASVQMILAREGVEIPQATLAQMLGTNETVGTTINAIESLLVSRGFKVMRKNNATIPDIEEALTNNAAVMVGYVEPTENVPHYALISSVDMTDIFLTDPWHGPDYRIPRNTFLELWKDDEANAYGNRMMLAVFSSKK